MSAPGVRISGGELKGSRLKVPPGVRPTGQRVREALCSRWQVRLPGATVLDLFAGSGAVGLEAASRGASGVMLIEADPRVYQELTTAAARLAPETTRTRRARLPEELSRIAGDATFDLVFADPPYAFADWDALLEAIAAVFAPSGEVVIEHSRRVALPQRVAHLGWESTRPYGDAALSFYREMTT